MKKLLSTMMLLFMIVPCAYAGLVMGGATVSAPAGADYVPATVEVEFRGDNGEFVVVGIYNLDLSLVTNGISAAINDSASGYANSSFTSCSALTPGNTYKVAFMPSGYCVNIGNNASGYTLRYNSSLTYPNLPANLANSGGAEQDHVNFRIKNAAGSILLSYTSGSSNVDLGDNTRAYFNVSGYTCATL